MSVTTAYDLVKGALKLLQVYAPDITMSPEEANDGLDSLNLLVESLSLESYAINYETKETFTLTPNQVVHTWGAGGDFNSSRPLRVDMCTINVSGTDWNVKLMAYDDWASIRLKTLNTNYTQYGYIEENFPLANVHLWPIAPAANQITFYSRKLLQSFPDLTTQINLPPGYKQLLRYMLAIAIAPEYQTVAGEDIMRVASATKANIKRVNYRPITATADIAMLGPSAGTRFNIYRGN